MKQDVNYILHHKGVNLKLIDSDLNSTHISLYNALFLIWNNCGFDTDLSVNRNDVMKLSKIGSANTYTKCLKELDKVGVLKYKPSHNPLIGSKINLYRFDNSSDNTTDNSSVKSSSKGSDNSIDTLSKQLNKETIKLINNNTSLINSNLKKWIELDVEDSISELNTGKTNKDFFLICSKDLVWVEACARNKKTDIQTINNYLSGFLDWLELKEDYKPNIKGFKSHFVNWLNKKEIKPVNKNNPHNISF